MLLKDLVKDLDKTKVIGSLDVKIEGLAYDSRQVKPGDVFIAIPGLVRDGFKFAPQAVKKGAKVIVSEKDKEVKGVAAQIIVPSARVALAKLAHKLYDFPSQKMKVVGITGTKGKTTISYLVDSIFRQAGFKTGVIGTIEAKILDEVLPAKLTTPESLDLQRLLSQMVEKGVTHVAMEVSSHALALERVHGSNFDLGIYTNLTHEHLDFHKTMKAYLETKLKLFREVKQAVINADDPFASQVAESVKGKVVTYGIKKKADIRAENIRTAPQHTKFTLVIKEGREAVETKLVGIFNVYNILAAVGCGLALGIDLATIGEALRDFPGVEGRYELVECGQPYAVIVDFAHSPDSLQKLLETVRPRVKGKLILVFGCPGERDKTKRPMMGEIAARLSDYAIISTDNPHGEKPKQIIDEIEPGLIKAGKKQGKNYLKIEKRKMAIRKALELANPKDTVVVAGRGHEKYQDFGGKIVEIDDREVVREYLKKSYLSRP